MFTSLLRTSALVALIATWGAESARRSTASDETDTASFLARSAIFDIDTVATASPDALLGVEVVAENVCVSELSGDGFWVTPDQDQESRTFVLPAEGRLIKVRVGESVTLHGEVRLTPSLLHEHADALLRTSRTASQLTPYLYAYTVRPAWPNANQRQRRTRSDLCLASHRDPNRAE